MKNERRLKMLSRLIFLSVFCLAAFLHGQETVKVGHFFKPDNMEGGYTRELISFMEQHPDILVEQWVGLSPAETPTDDVLRRPAPDIGLSYFTS
jgi:hypothetical protein